jgi:hypothetical protein
MHRTSLPAPLAATGPAPALALSVSVHVVALALLALFFGTLSPAALGAQETDDPDRWGAEVGFSLNSSGGNEQLTVLLTQIGITHLETESYEANVGGRFRYGRSEGVEVAQNLRGNLSVDLWPKAGWSPFVFATAENDPFRRLDVRLNSGGGVKRTFWQAGWSEVSLSGAVLYSYEQLELDESQIAADPLADGISQTALWSWRGRARKEFGEGRRFEQVMFYQPEWDDAGDYMLESQTSGRWSLTRSLAFTTTFLYERDSTPAQGVAADDWSLAVGLTAATRW